MLPFILSFGNYKILLTCCCIPFFLMKMDFAGKDIISIKDFSKKEINYILDYGKKMLPYAKGKNYRDILKGKVLSTLFFYSSPFHQNL